MELMSPKSKGFENELCASLIAVCARRIHDGTTKQIRATFVRLSVRLFQHYGDDLIFILRDKE